MKHIEEQAKELWNKTFGDSREYIDKFFNLYFKEGNFFHLEENGKLLSMLFATHHRLKIDDKIVPIAYIGSVCTQESHRNQGLANLLMQKAESELSNLGKKAVILIAAHEGLVPFYEKMGYKLCGIEGIKKISYNNNPNYLSEYKIEKTKNFNFDLINKVQQTRNNCIIHSTTTLQLYTQTDYDIISLYKNDEILAQCVAIIDWDTIEVLDCFCLKKETAEIVAKKISEEFKKDVNFKYFPDSLSAIPSTIEMIKPLKNIELPNEIFMSLNLDT